MTIRDVPDDVRVGRRAARAGQSLQEYLRGVLVNVAAKPTVEEVLNRARARVSVTRVCDFDPGATLQARDADRVAATGSATRLGVGDSSADLAVTESGRCSL